MQSDTGMRLAEAAGLHLDDIKLDEDIPLGGYQTASLEAFEDQRQSKTSAVGRCIAAGSTACQSTSVLMLCLPKVH